MPSDLAFKRLDDGMAGLVTLDFEGEAVTARPGDSVAAALLAAGHWVFRETQGSGAPRGPFCMMGACFECLLEIDGEPNRQACMTRAAEGMKVQRMHGAPNLRGGTGSGG